MTYDAKGNLERIDITYKGSPKRVTIDVANKKIIEKISEKGPEKAYGLFVIAFDYNRITPGIGWSYPLFLRVLESASTGVVYYGTPLPEIALPLKEPVLIKPVSVKAPTDRDDDDFFKRKLLKKK